MSSRLVSGHLSEPSSSRPKPRRSALAPAFVVTVSATACTPSGPTVEPPRPEPSSASTAAATNAATVATTTEASAAPSATASEPAPTTAATGTASAAPPRRGPLNPTTDEGRTIMLSFNGAGCFVYLDYPPLKEGQVRPPGTPPPTREVACPPSLADAAFASCRGGVVRAKGDACECFVSGNPPRIRPNPCPETGL